MLKFIQTVQLLIVLTCFSSLIKANELEKLLVGGDDSEKALTDKVIELKHNRQSDTLIKKRLNQIYSELDELKNLKVSVTHGVVTLGGEVDSKATEEKALQFARQIQDVVEVKNELKMTHSLEKRLNKIYAKLKMSSEQFLAELPLILLAFLVFYLFWVTGRWLSNRESLFRRISVNAFIADLLGKLTHLTFILVGIVSALSILDATALLGTILGAAGILGLAISFAVRDTVENFIASLLLSIRNPFEVNDFVDIEGFLGSVARLTSRATILMSPEGNHVRIPNSTVFKATIVNYTRHPNRRFQFDIGIGVGENLSQAQQIILQTLMDMTGLLNEPKPLVIIHEIGNSNVILRVYGWINQNEYDFLKVRSEAIKLVKNAIEMAEIAMPNPIYDINLTPVKTKHDVVTTDEKDISKTVIIGEEESGDVAADTTLKEQIIEENSLHADENLLAPDAAKEI